jgi:hypothetical protein
MGDPTWETSLDLGAPRTGSGDAMNDLVFGYGHRWLSRGLLCGLGVGLPVFLIFVHRGKATAVVALAVLVPIVAAAVAYVFLREFPEPRRFIVRGDIIEVHWPRASRQFQLTELKITRPQGSLIAKEKAVRVTVGDTSFLIFDNLLNFQGLLALLGEAATGPPARGRQEKPGGERLG